MNDSSQLLVPQYSTLDVLTCCTYHVYIHVSELVLISCLRPGAATQIPAFNTKRCHLNGWRRMLQRQKALERLQKNLKEEYRAVVDYEVAFFNTVSSLDYSYSVSTA